MASRIQIIVEGTTLDLPNGNINLPLTYALKDRSGIAINTGTRSEYSFTLPATKTNDSVYQRFWNVGEINPDAQIYKPAQILVDGLPYFSGKAQMKSVTLQPDLHGFRGKEYKIAFYGSNIDWVADLSDKYIVDYTYQTFVYDYADIAGYCANTYGLGDDYTFRAIKWKDWAYADAADLLEFTPCIFIKTILDKAFQELGYTLDSTFLNTTFFERLGMPIPVLDRLTEQYGLDYLNVELFEPTTSIVTVSAPHLFSTQPYAPAIGPNPYNAGTGDYTVPYDGYYLISGVANISNVTGTVGWEFNIYKNGLTTPDIILTAGDISTATITGNTQLKAERVFPLNAGDTIKAGLFGNIGTGTGDYNMRLTIIGEVEPQAGQTIDFKYLINKEWKVLDMIKGLAHAFNLTFQTDVDSQVITIEPADRYLYEQWPTTQTLNDGFYSNSDLNIIDDKVDILEGAELTSKSDIPNRLKLSWQYDSADPTQEAINAESDIKVLQARFNFPSDRFKDGENVIENPFFAATLCIFDEDVKWPTSDKTPLFPIIWPENYIENPTATEANYDIKPRLLVCQPQLNTLNGDMRVWNGSNKVIFPAPLAYMFNYNSTESIFISLSFGDEALNGVTVQGLMKRFYLQELTRTNRGKELELSVFYDLLDIKDLDFSRIVQLQGNNYILQEIKAYNVLSNKSTKTYLLYNEPGDGTEGDDIESTLITSRIIL